MTSPSLETTGSLLTLYLSMMAAASPTELVCLMVLPGHNADADALAVNDRNAGDVVEELLHGLDGVGGSGGDDVRGHDAGNHVSLLLLEDLAGVVLSDVLVTGETPVRGPLSGGNDVLVNRVGDVWLVSGSGVGLEALESRSTDGLPRAADLQVGTADSGDSASGGDGNSGVHSSRSLWFLLVRSRGVDRDLGVVLEVGLLGLLRFAAFFCAP